MRDVGLKGLLQELSMLWVRAHQPNLTYMLDN